jgi:outer membrane protein assembly factor BamD
MDGLRFKIELKNYDAVKLYERTQNYRAAVTTSMTFLEDYPRSKFKEEISFILVKNSYYLAVNSIDSKKKERIEQTIERYRNFATEFPESSMKKEANQISDEMYKELQKIESTK